MTVAIFSVVWFLAVIVNAAIYFYPAWIRVIMKAAKLSKAVKHR
jgi:hypothetical protein